MRIRHRQLRSGFTIVELLIVIVVIGILAAIIIISYVGISKRAITVTIQSDLANASKQLKLFQINDPSGNYPEENECPTPSAGNICLKTSGSNEISYSADNSSNPKTFTVDITNEDLHYRITPDTEPTAVSGAESPTVTTPTVSSIASSSAILGARITSDGGDTITAFGICWGTSSNPTSNCSPIENGSLMALSTRDIDVGLPGNPNSANPIALTVSADDKYIYAINASFNNISLYSRNSSTGSSTPLATPTVAAGTQPVAIVVSSDNKHIYVRNAGSISMYQHNESTGIPAPLSPASVSMSDGCASNIFDIGSCIAISADGSSVYSINATTKTLSMFSRDTTSGQLTLLSPATIATGNKPISVAVSQDNKNVYVTNADDDTISMYDRDTSTGLLSYTTPATVGAGDYTRGITLSANGENLYAINETSRTISMYTRDTDTGLLTAMTPSTVPTGTGPFNIRVSSDELSVYVANYDSGSISLYSRNADTGLLTTMTQSSIQTDVGPWSIALSSDGYSIYSVNQMYGTMSMFSRNSHSSPFRAQRTGLPSNTLIYYRGYATNSIGTSYSSDGTFTTLP